jgi:hypothetical protein
MKQVIKNLYTLKGGEAQERTNELKSLLGLGSAATGIVLADDLATEISITGASTTAVSVAGTSTTGISVSGACTTGLSITGVTTTAAIDITSCSGRAIRIGTKGTTYGNSTALAITSIGGTLDTDPAKNYMVGVFTKVQGNESTGATDDLGSAWFRTRTDTGVTTPAGYSLYGIKSQLRIYSASSAGATAISNWAAAGMLGVLEVSGAATTFASGCIAAAVYANVALGTGTTITSGGIVAAIAAISASSVITSNSGAGYLGVYIGISNAVVFDVGLKIATSCCTTGINIGTCTTGITIGTATTGISMTGTITNAIDVTAAANVTSFIKFNAIAGCVIANDVDPKDVPSTGGLGADGAIKVLINATPYYIPIFDGIV